MKIDLTSLRGLDAHRSADAELATRLEELNAEASGQPFNDEQRAEFAQVLEDRQTLAGIIEELEARDAAVAAALGRPEQQHATERAFAVPTVVRAAEDVFDLAAYRKRAQSVDDLPGLYRDGAMRVLDGLQIPNTDAAASKARIAGLVEKHKDDRNGIVAQRIIGTSSPVYVEAWAQAMRGRPLNGRMLAVLQSYSDGTDGGYALPVAIDPTFVLTSNGSANPLRQPGWARVETITGKSWQAVTTAGVTAAYSGERTTTGASDGAFTDMGNPTLTPLRADVNVPASLEYLGDYGTAALAAEVGRIVRDAKDTLEASKFVMGAGTTEPDGIVAWLITDTNSLHVGAGVGTFVLGDIDSLIGSLPDRFEPNAKMMAHNAILQLVPAFGTAGQPADSIYAPQSRTLRGYPVARSSAMDSTVATGKEILLIGDFSNFVIVDRLGMTSKVLDAYDGSGNPTGNSNFYFAWRNTSAPLFANAFRLLQVK